LSPWPTRTVSCTLCEYVLENANDYETATEVLIRRLGNLPNNTSVLIQPAFMAYSPMFYLPDLVFCCQLTGKKTINREVPDYLFSESADPDVGVVLVSREQYQLGDPVPLEWRWGVWDTVELPVQLVGTEFLDGPFQERSRPEIPRHSFTVEEFEHPRNRDLSWVFARRR